MTDNPPDIHAFPARRLGAFLRAMADPEGPGALGDEQERDIASLERSVAPARQRADDAPPRQGSDD